MNKIISITLLMVCVLISCTENRPEDFESGKLEHKLSVDKTTLSFGGNSNLTAVLNVKGENVEWRFSGYIWSNWIEIEPASGRNSATVNLTVKTNPSADEDRSETIELYSYTPGYDETILINVNQKGEVLFESEVESYVFTKWPQNKYTWFTTNVEVEAECSASWITLKHTYYDSSRNRGYVNFEVGANDTNAREATIKLKRKWTDDYLASISIHQDAEPSSEKDKVFTVTGNGKTVSFRMKHVEAGTFMMGSDDDPEDHPECMPIHKVTLTKDYYIGETEVTQALWYAVTGGKPLIKDSNGSYIGDSGWNFTNYVWESKYGLGDDYPAYSVNYIECQEFIRRLNEMTGLSFRLPTEAEWEYAARGGNKSNGYIYSGGDNLDNVAWHSGNSKISDRESSHPVKTKAANELGIYDMSGNVSEWCQDWYDPTYYSNSPQNDPTGPKYPKDEERRVRRGGNYSTYGDGNTHKITCRFGAEQDYYLQSYYGLRIVLQY